MKNLHDMLMDSWWTQHPAVRILLFILGIVLILLGFLLGFVPLLPGFPLGILGVILLSISSARVRHLLLRGIEKLPLKWQQRLHFMHGSDNKSEKR